MDEGVGAGAGVTAPPEAPVEVEDSLPGERNAEVEVELLCVGDQDVRLPHPLVLDKPHLVVPLQPVVV